MLLIFFDMVCLMLFVNRSCIGGALLDCNWMAYSDVLDFTPVEDGAFMLACHLEVHVCYWREHLNDPWHDWFNKPEH